MTASWRGDQLMHGDNDDDRSEKWTRECFDELCNGFIDAIRSGMVGRVYREETSRDGRVMTMTVRIHISR